MCEEKGASGMCQKGTKKVIPPLSPSALTTFFEETNKAKQKPAIFKITQPYAQEFIPKSVGSTLPPPMMELYDPEALHLDYLSLLAVCESTFDKIMVHKSMLSTYILFLVTST